MESKLLAILDEVNPEITQHMDEDLIAEGVIDSLDIMMIVSAIEDAFDIEIAPEDITSENFSTVQAIETLINVIKNKI